MLKWIAQYRQAGRETKLFIFTSIIWTLAVILPAIFCYARLDFVRTGKRTETVPERKTAQNTNQKTIKYHD